MNSTGIGGARYFHSKVGEPIFCAEIYFDGLVIVAFRALYGVLRTPYPDWRIHFDVLASCGLLIQASSSIEAKDFHTNSIRRIDFEAGWRRVIDSSSIHSTWSGGRGYLIRQPFDMKRRGSGHLPSSENTLIQPLRTFEARQTGAQILFGVGGHGNVSRKIQLFYPGTSAFPSINPSRFPSATPSLEADHLTGLHMAKAALGMPVYFIGRCWVPALRQDVNNTNTKRDLVTSQRRGLSLESSEPLSSSVGVPQKHKELCPLRMDTELGAVRMVARELARCAELLRLSMFTFPSRRRAGLQINTAAHQPHLCPSSQVKALAPLKSSRGYLAGHKIRPCIRSLSHRECGVFPFPASRPFLDGGSR
ncbi:uncharacterized protein CIMG_12802 [Coccidioides immitis RS]|uniref:Uncharacterized protein n=1 Tax=Coccidioides immitis (strain RS) TaxID=246410 RepID=A0A0D8JTD2_COCIM|nr:uncharacterized protein CIMG_12802 [Coccidioides immitis RS]KJF60206.1 hypothetical protein CIMG_12802 [Coccidioides immitis RS]